METLFAQFIPKALHRIEFWRVRRQGQQLHVGRRNAFIARMPTDTIEHHHEMVIGMAQSGFVQENLHAMGVDLGQDQRVHHLGCWLYSRVSIGVLVLQHGDAHRAMGPGSPAPAHIVDAAKSCLVLEHHPDGRTDPVLADFLELFGEFFFHASCATGSLWG